MKKLLSILLVLTSVMQIQAADMKVATLANKCSGLFLIMTMPSDENLKPFVQNMSTLSETMSMIAAGIYDINNIALTNGDLRDMRNKRADEVLEIEKIDRQINLDLYAKCDGLRENFAFVALQEDDDRKILNSLSLPENNAMSEQKVFLINSILDLSFQELEDAGISSIVELYKNL